MTEREIMIKFKHKVKFTMDHQTGVKKGTFGLYREKNGKREIFLLNSSLNNPDIVSIFLHSSEVLNDFVEIIPQFVKE